MRLNNALGYVHHNSGRKGVLLKDAIAGMEKAEGYFTANTGEEPAMPYDGMARSDAKGLNRAILGFAKKAEIQRKSVVGREPLKVSDLRDACDERALEASKESKEFTKGATGTMKAGAIITGLGVASVFLVPPIAIAVLGAGSSLFTLGALGALTGTPKLDQEAADLKKVSTQLDGWDGTLKNQSAYFV